MSKEKAETEMTSIGVTIGFKNRLEKLKIHPNQSFEELLRDIMKKAGV